MTMAKNGDVVFFKTAKLGSHRKAPTVAWQGHAFGILLGHVPPFQKDPPPEHLLRLMGTIGFVSFDDIGELLGDEQAAELVKKFEDKYYGKIIEKAPDVVEAVEVLETDEAPQNTGIVGLDGQAISSSDRVLETAEHPETLEGPK